GGRRGGAGGAVWGGAPPLAPRRSGCLRLLSRPPHRRRLCLPRCAGRFLAASRTRRRSAQRPLALRARRVPGRVGARAASAARTGRAEAQRPVVVVERHPTAPAPPRAIPHLHPLP